MIKFLGITVSFLRRYRLLLYREIMKKLICLLFAVLLLCVLPPTMAANFTVATAAELIAAISAANSNAQDDRITLTADITLTAVDNMLDGANGLPSILADGGSSLTIDGAGFTISRSGATAFRIMHISAGANVFINDLGIANGLASASGLGTLGAGIFALGNLNLTIDSSRFTGNTATTASGLGAGIFSSQVTLNLSNSTFSGNTGSGGGAAVYTNLDNANITGNTFSGNNAPTGAAIMNEGGNVTLINNTISGNTATGFGGGFASIGGTTILTNNTVTNNTAGTGGGIFSFFGTVTLRNNVIAGNSASTADECDNSGAVMNGNAYNIFGVSGSAGGCPAGASDIVPAGGIATILAPLADNGGLTFTHELATNSPALDAANFANCPPSDQRGFLRGFDADGTPNSPEAGDCDIGAFEASLDPAYDSDPAVGATIDLGSTIVGTEISTILEIIEAGGAALLVSLDGITGANAADFRVIGLPTTIGDNNPPQEVAIICSPSAAGGRTAQITFDTNDPLQPTVSYDVECTGIDPTVATASITEINQLVTEGNTIVNVTVQLAVPAGFSNTGDVTVDIVDAVAGNATSGADYTAFAPTPLTFTGPLTAGATYTQTVTVNVLDDNITEGAEYFALEIDAVTGAAEIGSGDSHTIIINDNDGIFAQASFSANSAIVDEDAGTLTVDVRLFIPAGFSMTGDITLTITDALTGNATSGTDYGTFAPVTLTFVDAPFVIGTTYTQTITIPILDDDAGEGVETFDLGITGVTGPVELQSPAAFTGIINDDEITTEVINRMVNGETIVIGGGEQDYVVKTVDKPFATAGQTVTYTIRARNPKTIPLTQVVIYDVFDERLTDIRLLSITHGAGSFNANTLTVRDFTLQPNEEVTIVVSARIASLRAGDTIPNAAILESPDASVHVSNLALVGAVPQGNAGGAAQVLIIPGQLPETGETPTWRWGVLGGIGLVLAVGMRWLRKRA